MAYPYSMFGKKVHLPVGGCTGERQGPVRFPREKERSMSSSDNPAIKTSQKVPAKAWLILAVTYLASFVAPMAQFKVPPLASLMIPAFGMDGATFGMLMSCLAIIGVILAFPAAFICRKIGLKSAMLVSVACVCAGSLVGGLTDNLTVLMLSRMLEGVGIGLVGVAAPTCITVWFPRERCGLALGIWTTWVPVSIILMFNTAPAIADIWGFRSVFLIVAAVAAVAFILFATVFSLPEGESGDITAGGRFSDGLKLLKNKNIWLLGIVFFCFCGTSLGITNTYYNTFLEQVRGFTSVDSSFVTSMCTLFGIPVQIFAGWLVDRIRLEHRRFLIAAVCLIMGLSFLVMFHSGAAATGFMWSFVVLQAIGASFNAGANRPTAPMLVRGGALGAVMAMAVLQFTQNLGAAVCSPLFGAMKDALGWEPAGLYLQIPLIVIAFVCALFIIPKREVETDNPQSV